jgi:dipeptide transport system ATP-binding protein
VSLLEVRNWKLGFQGEDDVPTVLNGINLKIEAGTTVGLVGESGSGKSVMGLSILGLLPNNAKLLGGEIFFEGKKIAPSSEKELEKLRGDKISMIFQDPVSSLNPAFTVEYQLAETLKIHQKGTDLRERCLDLLRMVGIPDPEARLTAYPHQLSGGMAQRVMIAMAIACQPKILIADEPTTALDVTIQAQILGLLKNLQKETGLSILLISHDMGVISQNCDRVYVMYCGEIVEEGLTKDVIHHPGHPYTRALLNCMPGKYVFSSEATMQLPSIPGTVPSLRDRPTGCVFRTRCPLAQEICKQKPPYVDLSNGQKSLCHFSK